MILIVVVRPWWSLNREYHDNSPITDAHERNYLESTGIPN